MIVKKIGKRKSVIEYLCLNLSMYPIHPKRFYCRYRYRNDQEMVEYNVREL